MQINTPHFNTILESVLVELNEAKKKKTYSAKKAKKGKKLPAKSK